MWTKSMINPWNSETQCGAVVRCWTMIERNGGPEQSIKSPEGNPQIVGKRIFGLHGLSIGIQRMNHGNQIWFESCVCVYMCVCVVFLSLSVSRIQFPILWPFKMMINHADVGYPVPRQTHTVHHPNTKAYFFMSWENMSSDPATSVNESRVLSEI